MTTALLAKSTRIGSPVGPIPECYPHLTQLCMAAFIRYNDEITEGKDGETFSVRTWRIVRDPSGKSVTNHIKFCMLLDLLSHDHPDWKMPELYDAAIGLKPHGREKLYGLNWKDLHDYMAELGVSGYEKFVPKPTRGGNFKQFADVLE